jgi:hypothetical protein
MPNVASALVVAHRERQLKPGAEGAGELQRIVLLAADERLVEDLGGLIEVRKSEVRHSPFSIFHFPLVFGFRFLVAARPKTLPRRQNASIISAQPEPRARAG